MMNFPRQVAHHKAFVSMDSVSFAFVNILGLKIKMGSHSLVLGNGDQVLMDMYIKVHVNIQ